MAGFPDGWISANAGDGGSAGISAAVSFPTGGEVNGDGGEGWEITRQAVQGRTSMASLMALRP